MLQGSHIWFWRERNETNSFVCFDCELGRVLLLSLNFQQAFTSHTNYFKLNNFCSIMENLPISNERREKKTHRNRNSTIDFYIFIRSKSPFRNSLRHRKTNQQWGYFIHKLRRKLVIIIIITVAKIYMNEGNCKNCIQTNAHTLRAGSI